MNDFHIHAVDFATYHSLRSLSTKTTTIPHMPPTLTINNLAGRDPTQSSTTTYVRG